jgi:hypothetical protein
MTLKNRHTVFLMKFLNVKSEFPLQDYIIIKLVPVADGSKFGTWVVRKWVEIEPIYVQPD